MCITSLPQISRQTSEPVKLALPMNHSKVSINRRLGSKCNKSLVLTTFGISRMKSDSVNVPYNTPKSLFSNLDTITEDIDVVDDTGSAFTEPVQKNEPVKKNEPELCMIEGSIKCYLNKPIIELGVATLPILNVLYKEGDAFSTLLKDQNPNQHTLYLQGGLFNRYANQLPSTNTHNQSTYNMGTNLLVRSAPVIQRSFSYNSQSIGRITRTISQND
jgi:hypothetical protein